MKLELYHAFEISLKKLMKDNIRLLIINELIECLDLGLNYKSQDKRVFIVNFNKICFFNGLSFLFI
jgi:hypothetical protein